MKKLTTLASAVALVAGMTVAASAQTLQPANETPTQGLGGAGDGLILPPPVLAATIVAIVIGATTGDDTVTTTTD